MTQPKVVGRRLGRWETWDVKSILVFLAGPIFVVLALRSFANHGDIVYTGFFAAIGVAGTAFSIWALVTSPSLYVVVSACPICGASDTRYFGYAADKKRARPVACKHCLAYLRVNAKNLEVREESLTAVYDMTQFEVTYGQFWWVVPRRDDEDHTFMLEMPAMCSVCCSPQPGFQERWPNERPRCRWHLERRDVARLGKHWRARRRETQRNARPRREASQTTRLREAHEQARLLPRRHVQRWGVAVRVVPLLQGISRAEQRSP